MNRSIAAAVLAAHLILPPASAAGPRDDVLSRYAAEAKAASAAYAGFSAARGKTLHHQKFAGGKPDTPACTTCHGNDPRNAGRTAAGKIIDPVAVSISPTRYTDAAKVEKWFKRNCSEVLGRECTAIEKGDWLTYMMQQ